MPRGKKRKPARSTSACTFNAEKTERVEISTLLPVVRVTGALPQNGDERQNTCFDAVTDGVSIVSFGQTTCTDAGGDGASTVSFRLPCPRIQQRHRLQQISQEQGDVDQHGQVAITPPWSQPSTDDTMTRSTGRFLTRMSPLPCRFSYCRSNRHFFIFGRGRRPRIPTMETEDNDKQTTVLARLICNSCFQIAQKHRNRMTSTSNTHSLVARFVKSRWSGVTKNGS